MLALKIYTRPGCHLCDEMKALVRSVSRMIPLSLEDIDIFADDELEALYGLEIPVLFIEETRIATGRITEDALVRILTSGVPGSNF